MCNSWWWYLACHIYPTRIKTVITMEDVIDKKLTTPHRIYAENSLQAEQKSAFGR